MRQTFKPRTAGARHGCPVRFNFAGVGGRRGPFAWGCRSFRLRPSPHHQHSFLRRRLHDLHRLVGPGHQQIGGNGLLVPAAHDLIGDHCLIGIHCHMLHCDLLLPTTSMLIGAVRSRAQFSPLCRRVGDTFYALQSNQQDCKTRLAGTSTVQPHSPRPIELSACPQSDRRASCPRCRI